VTLFTLIEIQLITTSDLYLLILIFLPGITLGGAQWLCLYQLKGAYLWIIASAFGIPIVLLGMFWSIVLIHFASYSYAGNNYLFPVVVILRGLFTSLFTIPMGITQWVFLRRHHKNAGLWIPATCAGYFLGLSSFFAASPALLMESLGVFLGVLVITLVIIPAGITGLLLISFKPKVAKEATKTA